MDDTLTKSEREALKAIYRLTRDGSEAHTGALADVLGLSPGTVTTTVKRLADRGFVDHRPYQGVTFTAARPADRRRPPSAATASSSASSPTCSATPGTRPTSSPSGSSTSCPTRCSSASSWRCTARPPAPTASRSPTVDDAELPATPDLYALEPGEVAEVALSGSTDPELVTFLGTLGLVPGVEVVVVEKHPFDGPLVVTVDGQDRTLGERVARQIYVNRRARQR